MTTFKLLSGTELISLVFKNLYRRMQKNKKPITLQNTNEYLPTD